ARALATLREPSPRTRRQRVRRGWPSPSARAVAASSPLRHVFRRVTGGQRLSCRLRTVWSDFGLLRRGFDRRRRPTQEHEPPPLPLLQAPPSKPHLYITAPARARRDE